MSARLAVVSALLVACAGPAALPSPSATPSPSPSPVPTASPSPTPTPLPARAVRFTVNAARSLATIRVREQVAGVPLPGEAVLTTGAFSGTLVLLADGTFAAGSVLDVALDTLDSDSDLRDEWIKINTLDTRRYPRAEVVMHRLAGVPLPLPATGEWQATLESTMRVRGVDRPVTWALVVTRGADGVRARGETTFRFGDHGMAVPANRLILSVVDEIRLAIDVVMEESP